MTDSVTTTSRARPITAGIVTALVGFTSSFAVVLTGLRAVGATPEQAASGLLALCVTAIVACGSTFSVGNSVMGPGAVASVTTSATSARVRMP